ncbi:MAG TPA: prepilin-type N-terminal cleavage/methylation domain-containing protein [Usitatibacter sp.]|nr:prepilin-type N-terminal cleavage/methylation domain-containing protein [Usitatibacter sp.]
MGSDPNCGFTLIEILVVIAIAGILVAVVSVNLFPSDEQYARREAGNVALAIEHARDAAWFGGLPTSVTFNEQRIREWRLAGREWRAVADRERALPQELRVGAVHVDGLRLAPQDRLLFFSDGLGIPFRVAMEVRGMQWAVEGDAAGAIRLVGP